MAKSGRRNKCPPGVFCISGGLGTTITIILVVALLFLLYAVFFIRPQAPTIIMPRPQAPQTTVIPIKGGDSRYDMAPQPLRDWMAPPDFPQEVELRQYQLTFRHRAYLNHFNL